MKQYNIKKEVDVFYNDNGSINRECSICISEEIIGERKRKPSIETINLLREQKRKIRESKLNPLPIDSNFKTIEVSIGEVLHKKVRGLNREHQLNEIVGLLGLLQRNRGIIDFNRNYLNQILKDYTFLKDKTRNRLLIDILNYAKTKKERVVTKKILKGELHFEKRLNGEKTKSCCKSVDKVWATKREIVNFYSFI